MAHWDLKSIHWDAFNPDLVDPLVLASVKAAAMVEYNSADYVQYLVNIFQEDPSLKSLIEQWGEEERQHGLALGQWATLADQAFSFEDSFKAFQTGYQIPLHATQSIRGSLSGELVSRCVIESGTSSFYKAMQEGVEEPVLKQISGLIAADEFRHYKLFYDILQNYLKRHPLSIIRRVKIALGRVAEAEDDELAYAYYAANLLKTGKDYKRVDCWKAYQSSTLAFYKKKHVGRLTSMVFKAAGMKPHSWISSITSSVLWFFLSRQQRSLLKV
jgi:rubrerythrin